MKLFRPSCLPLLTFFLVIAAVGSRAADPAYYLKQATWQETMLASLEALAGAGLEHGFPAFESETLRGGSPAQSISIPLNGAEEMVLFVDGFPDVKWGVADWAEARLIRADGSSEWVADLQDLKVFLGRYEKNLTLRAGLYQKMRLNGREFDHGLCAQAPSIIRVQLDGEFQRFEARIGVDDWAGNQGHVRFSVLGSRSAACKRLFEWVTRDFPAGPQRRQMRWEIEDRIFEFDWQAGDWQTLAQRYAKASHRILPVVQQVRQRAETVTDKAGLEKVRADYYQSRELAAALARAREFDFEAAQLAIRDLWKTFGAARYAGGPEYLARLTQLQRDLENALKVLRRNESDTSAMLADYKRVAQLVSDAERLRREALLANPWLDFEELLVLKRKPLGDARRNHWQGYGYGEFLGIPRQSSWNYGTMPNVDGWENEIAVLASPQSNGKVITLFKPDHTRLINDIDLHWDADKVLFSMPDQNKNWQIHELKLNPSLLSSQLSNRPRQLTPSLHRDVHNYDAIYLPSSDIVFLSTAPLQGVPCNASVIVGMMYKMNQHGQFIRQLTFEQDHDYTPSVLNNGRVIYLRWDYTDTPHVWNRLLMSMNPDGTGQMEYYGANSYWPNSIFFARAIPGHETKIATIVTGHHEGRVGDLVIFDPALGRHETQGVVQRIPGRGQKVEPLIEDKLTEHNWPKFLHPWPLSENHFLVAGKPEPDALWGIYLVDVFDNMILLKAEEGYALMEPIPFAKRPRPPVIQPKSQPIGGNALVYMEDVYRGPGMRGVPSGTVKNLRIFSYHFGYQKLAGIDHRVGLDGPWEAKRVLGVVPVEEDGSAFFAVPAKTPVSFQPLDEAGKAVALMRSWMTAMPGESVSCVGCHDRQSTAPAGSNRRTALNRAPSMLKSWRGPARGFSFIRDVQPVLDKFCVGCHDGQPREGNDSLPDLRREQDRFWVCSRGELDGKFVSGKPKQELLGKYGAVFEPSYAALRQYVRVGGLESDLHLLPPMEFHANTSELIQMLIKGHHGVALDEEGWDRLVTWIDLNAPCHGTWGEVTQIPGNQGDRRLELRRLYGGVMEDQEDIPEIDSEFELPEPILPQPVVKPASAPPSVADWPFGADQARRMQKQRSPITRTVDLGRGVHLELVRLPAGAFVMGDGNGAPDEQPLSAVPIEHPFWMGRCEISNEQYAQFDPLHDSRFEHRSSWIFAEHYLGWPLNEPKQPVVRISWQEAQAFCQWLSAKLGEKAALPTEAQWEWACRAGTDTPFSYGDLDTDFARWGNMGDANLRRLASEGWRPLSPDLIPREARFDDGALVTTEIGHYQPNAWGLHDLHGNVAEWTRTTWRPYPYRSDDGRNAASSEGDKVIRGGSWRDRPRHCRSGSRWAYPSWQKVFNAGFRVVIEPDSQALADAR